MTSSDGEKIHSIRFNQSKGMFVCCLDSGVRIYNIEPLKELAHFKTDRFGSIKLGEILERSNYFAVVGGGATPKFAENTVLVYDDFKNVFALEITLASTILGVRLQYDKMIVVLRRKIYVFTLEAKSKVLFSCVTRVNPKGLCEASILDSEKKIMCFPAQKCGAVQIVDMSSTEAKVSQAPLIIEAHESELACLSLTRDGLTLATASTHGTLIRVWDTVKRTKLIELRRGSDPATIYCINFSLDTAFLCCSSDKGTIHIFALKDAFLNKRSSLKCMGFLGGYAESQWALCNFTVPLECACICAFGSNSSVYAICVDGTFHKYVFNSDATCSREAFDIFLDLCSCEDF